MKLREYYELPELDSVVKWLRALPNYNGQDQIYYRSGLTRMQFEELLGRPAPSFVEAPARLTLLQQLKLVHACQQYGWRSLSERLEPINIVNFTRVGEYELNENPLMLQYMEEAAASGIGKMLLDNGYLRREVETDTTDMSRVVLRWSLDLRPQPTAYQYNPPQRMGNAFYDARGEAHEPSMRRAA